MNLKEYLKENNISMYSLSKQSGIAYSTINDLVNGKVDVDNCKVSVLRGLSSCIGIGMEELYKLLDRKTKIVINEKGAEADIIVSDKTYYVNFEYESQMVRERVAKVNRRTSEHVKKLAEWTVADYIEEMEFSKFSKKAIADYKKRTGRGQNKT